MNDRINVDSDAVTLHAQHVEQIAADVRVAIDAAGQTMLSSGAFGVMCAWMIPPFLAVATATTATLSSAASSIDRSARELRAAAADFDEHETAVSGKLSGVHSSIDAV